MGSAAHVPISWPVRPASLESILSGVTSSVAAGRLYVVSTPIGNLGDFSFRAIDVLRTVGLILSEDTRHSRTLLARYEIRTPVASYLQHNQAKMTPSLAARVSGAD